MATTPNFSWTTPNDSDPFKDGALAIRTLGNAVDSTLNTITNKQNVGLSLIKSQTFSGANTVSVTNVFSSAYTNYRIVFNGNTFINRQFIYLQMTGASTNYYWGANGWRASGAAYNANSNNTLPGFITTFADLDARNIGIVDIGAPNLPQYTIFSGNFVGGDSTSTLNGTAGGFLLNTTVYTGFTLAASNHIVGGVSVYGYRS
jgi:hypothetical protein